MTWSGTWSNEAVVVELVVDGVPHARASVAARLFENLLLQEDGEIGI